MCDNDTSSGYVSCMCFAGFSCVIEIYVQNKEVTAKTVDLEYLSPVGHARDKQERRGRGRSGIVSLGYRNCYFQTRAVFAPFEGGGGVSLYIYYFVFKKLPLFLNSACHYFTSV